VKPRHDDLGVGREPLRQPPPSMPALGLKSVPKTVELRDPASLGIPRWSRILRIASGFVIAARIFMRPRHFGRVSRRLRLSPGLVRRIFSLRSDRPFPVALLPYAPALVSWPML